MPPRRPKDGPAGNGAAPHTIHVIELDPFGPFTMLVPMVQTRIQAFATEMISELDHEAFTRNVMVRLHNGDRLQKVIIFWDADRQKIVGHALSEICAQGRSAWVFIHQCVIDDEVNVGDAVERAMTMVDMWATGIGDSATPPIKITRMTMMTGRNPAAWERRYGFKDERRIMVRPIGQPARVREPAEA